jgi:hypothetical protein
MMPGGSGHRVKHCATCGRDVPDSATLCDDCGSLANLFGSSTAAQAAASPKIDASPSSVPRPKPAATVVAMPAPAAAAAAAPHAAPRPTSPAPRGGLGQREMVLIGVGAFVAAVVTFGLFFSRGGGSSAAAAPASSARRGMPAPVPIRPAQPAHKWSDANRSFWLASQRHSAAFELEAENTVPTWQGRVRPSLVVRCVSKKVETFVYTRSAMKIEPNQQDKTVMVSFDSEPARTERWPDSQDHDALFAPDGTAFLERLTHARMLQFGYTPHNVEPVVAEFHVSGLAELLEPVAVDCGRAEERPQDARSRRPSRK